MDNDSNDKDDIQVDNELNRDTINIEENKLDDAELEDEDN